MRIGIMFILGVSHDVAFVSIFGILPLTMCNDKERGRESTALS